MTLDAVKNATQTLRDSTDMRELVQRLLPAQAWQRNGVELASSCPKCGDGGKGAKSDRFYVGRTFAACRQCHPQRMDAAGLVSWLHGVSMGEAVRMLGGEIQPAQRTAQPVQQARADDTPASDWRTFAARTVDAAQQRLWRSTMNGAGAAYLHGRGLTRDTWQAFGLGYEPARTLASDRKQHAPAVVWPLLHESTGEVVAVRYRYAGVTSTGDRYDGMKGGRTSGRLFGVQTLPPFVWMPPDVDSDGHERCAESWRTLALMEGEINAMSVWQACHGAGVDVLSTGSESQRTLPDWAVTLAMRYGSVLLWFDKADVAANVAQQLRGHSRLLALRSPVQDGVKVDANDMLISGILAGVIHTARLRVLTDAMARQCMLWQLWDSVNGVREALDSHVQSLVTELLAELGAEWRTMAHND